MREERIRASLDARAGLVRAPDDLWARIEDGARHPAVARRSRTPQRIGVIVTAFLVAVTSLGMLVRAFSERTGPSADSIRLTAREHRVGRPLGRLLVAAGAVWISGQGEVIRLDPKTGETEAVIPVRLEEGGRYGSVGKVEPTSGLAFGDGLVWVTAEPYFAAIDPATNEIATAILWESGVTNIAWDDGRLLYGGSAEGLGRTRLLDPYRGKSEDVNYIGSGADALVLATKHWYWSGGKGLGRASREGVEGQDLRGIESVDSMVAAGGYVWATGGGTLWQIDAGYEAAPGPTYHLTNDPIISERRVSDFAIVAGDDEHLWLLESGGDRSQLTLLSPATGKPLAPMITLNHEPTDMVASRDGAWIGFGETASVAIVSLTDAAT